MQIYRNNDLLLQNLIKQHTYLLKLLLNSKNSCKEYFVEWKQTKSTTAAYFKLERMVAKHVMISPN